MKYVFGEQFVSNQVSRLIKLDRVLVLVDFQIIENLPCDCALCMSLLKFNTTFHGFSYREIAAVE